MPERVEGQASLVEIGHLLDRLVAAWNTRDAEAFADLFVAHADYVTGDGHRLHGREAIGQLIDPASPAPGTASILGPSSIRLYGPTTAVANFRWSMTSPEGSTSRGVVTCVVAKRGDEWTIESLHNTDMHEPALTHDALARRGVWTTGPPGDSDTHKPAMTHTPPGWHSVTPRIVVEDAAGLVDFVKLVFEATGELHSSAPAQIRIGDSLIMVSAAGARETFPAFLYVYVEDPDATIQRALDAGATSLEAVWDTPYGDRRGMVRDRWGNVWQIATHKPR